MRFQKDFLKLYLVTDRSWLGEKSLAQQVEEAILGGVTMVQLREKELKGQLLLEEALDIKKLCHTYQIPFLINDNVELAKEVDADGVHVGQSDMNAVKAREILGPDKILGVTAKTIEQAIAAQKAGADYLGCGAVFSTTTKKDVESLNHEVLQRICQSVHIPVVAIGGITKDNVTKLKNRGICGISVISAILAQADIRKSAKTLHELVETML